MRLSATLFSSLFLLCALPHTAMAEEGLLDIDLGDFDLDGGGDDEESLTYEGSSSDSAPGYVAGKPVSITHYGGNISVDCTDNTGISARVEYVIEGTKRANMERLGNGIGLRAWGSSSSGGVSTRVPSTTSGIDSVEVALTVTLPKNVQAKITGRKGWIAARNCNGVVRATTSTGAIFVSGDLTRFEVTSTKGDVEIELSEGAKLTSTSKASASAGKIALEMPLDQSLRLDARGESVTISHIIEGNVGEKRVTGTIGGGGPSLTLYAKGPISIRSANE